MKLHLKALRRKHPDDIKSAQVIAIVVQRGHVVSVGYNRKLALQDGERFSQHAEEAALKKAGRRARQGTLYVYRFKKDDSYGLARPCNRCWNALIRAGIWDVSYSTDSGHMDLVRWVWKKA